jgi:hypothetical protein
MASRSSTRRVFGAGIIVGIVASVGGIQVAPLVAGAGVTVLDKGSPVSPSPRVIEDAVAPESSTDEYRRMYGRGAGEDGSLSMTSTNEYRQMYEHR